MTHKSQTPAARRVSQRGRTPKAGIARQLLRNIVAAAAAEFGFRASELLAGGGGHPTLGLSHARAVAMWVGYRTGQTTFAELAEFFGVGYPSCRARIKAIEARQARQPKLRARLDRLCDQVGIES